MAKRNKKETAVSYEFIEEINKLSGDQLVRRFIREENDIVGLDKQKKDDATIKDLSKQIKKREDAIKEEIDVLKEKIKEIREGDEDLEELKSNKRALESGYRDEKKRRKAHRDYLYNRVRAAFQA